MTKSSHLPTDCGSIAEPSESQVESYTYAPSRGIGVVAVGESPHVVDTEHAQNVVKSGAYLHIWTVGHCGGVDVGREYKQLRIVQRIVAPA